VAKLNDKQEAFAVAVVNNGGDKVDAFKQSGWSWESYSVAALSVQADKQFNHPKINLRIAELQAIKDKIAKDEFNIDSQYVLRRLKEIDELDVLDILKDDLSGFKALSEWPRSWRTSISGIDMKRMMQGDEGIEAVIEKIKWPDKTKNLELIGRHVSVKAFEKDTDTTGSDKLAEVLSSLIGSMPS
jgi:phage terminase small subunit